MTQNSFKALVLRRDDEKNTHAAIEDLTHDELPEHEVLVEVAYSSLNYKDGLAVTGAGPVVRTWPMVPGIDFAGTVVESTSDAYQPGDKVVLTGWGVGEKYWGGYSQMARAKADWLVPLPTDFAEHRAMAFGTAGLTAMMAVMALEANNLSPERGEVLVTGASGGVGSVAIALLAEQGYTVVASTGRERLHAYLRSLGATEIIDRGEFARDSKPMESGRWAGVIDAVGGQTLSTALAGMAYDGVVASVGLAGGHELNTTVYPFILRGVRLLGIDSVMAPVAARVAVWDRLRNAIPTKLDAITKTAPLADVPQLAADILAGQVQGRVVIDVNA